MFAHLLAEIESDLVSDRQCLWLKCNSELEWERVFAVINSVRNVTAKVQCGCVREVDGNMTVFRVGERESHGE